MLDTPLSPEPSPPVKPLLTPLSTGELFSKTIDIYRENFGRLFALLGITFLLGIAAVAVIIFIIIGAVAGGEAGGGAVAGIALLGLCAFIVVFFIAAILAGIVFNGIITHMASETILGREANLGASFQHVWARVWSLLGATIVLALGSLAVMIPIMFLAICLIGFLFMPVAFYYIWAAGVFLAPIILLEDIDAMDALSRGMKLARQHFWPIFTYLIALSILNYALQVLPQSISQAQYTQDPVTGEVIVTGSLVLVFVFSIISVGLGILMVPLTPIGTTLLYYDTRVTLENLGMDLAQQPTPDVEAITPPQSDYPSFTGQDAVNMLAATLIIIAFGLVQFSVQLILGFVF